MAPVWSGRIPEDGIVSCLGEIEATRASGVLRFRAGEVEGEVWLVGGQLSAEQPDRDDGQDPVELLLGLREGRAEVRVCLPPLAVTRGDDRHREGSLTVHVPADLLNYCESAGLTGRLVLRDPADHSAELSYRLGELETIRLDGPDDLSEVFDWEAGSFLIESKPREPEPKPGPQDAGPLLRVVEMSLAEIDRRAGAAPGRPSTQPPAVHERSIRASPRPPRADQTVQVIYLGEAPGVPELPAGQRHVQGQRAREAALPDARPERRSQEEAQPKGSPVRGPRSEPTLVDPPKPLNSPASTRAREGDSPLVSPGAAQRGAPRPRDHAKPDETPGAPDAASAQPESDIASLLDEALDEALDESRTAGEGEPLTPGLLSEKPLTPRLLSDEPVASVVLSDEPTLSPVVAPAASSEGPASGRPSRRSRLGALFWLCVLLLVAAAALVALSQLPTLE